MIQNIYIGERYSVIFRYICNGRWSSVGPLIRSNISLRRPHVLRRELQNAAKKTKNSLSSIFLIHNMRDPMRKPDEKIEDPQKIDARKLLL